MSRSRNWAAFGVLVADGLTTSLWILGGLCLWRKQWLGYLCGAGLLFQASLLFVGLLAFSSYSRSWRACLSAGRFHRYPEPGAGCFRFLRAVRAWDWLGLVGKACLTALIQTWEV